MKVTVMEYVWQRRLAIALEEILNGKRIIDVAIDLGWQSHSNFSKSFKKEYGVSPSMAKLIIFSSYEHGGSTMNILRFEFTNGTETKKQLEDILLRTLKIESTSEMEKVTKILDLSEKVYNDLTRYSGEKYITHPLNVAITLANLETDIDVVMAGLFCDASNKVKNFEYRDNEILSKQTKVILEELSSKELEEINLSLKYI